MFQFELHPHTGEICAEILMYEKGGGNKTCQSTSNKQSWASCIVKKNGPRDNVE